MRRHLEPWEEAGARMRVPLAGTRSIMPWRSIPLASMPVGTALHRRRERAGGRCDSVEPKATARTGRCPVRVSVQGPPGRWPVYMRPPLGLGGRPGIMLRRLSRSIARATSRRARWPLGEVAHPYRHGLIRVTDAGSGGRKRSPSAATASASRGADSIGLVPGMDGGTASLVHSRDSDLVPPQRPLWRAAEIST